MKMGALTGTIPKHGRFLAKTGGLESQNNVSQI